MLGLPLKLLSHWSSVSCISPNFGDCVIGILRYALDQVVHQIVFRFYFLEIKICFKALMLEHLISFPKASKYHFWN